MKRTRTPAAAQDNRQSAAAVRAYLARLPPAARRRLKDMRDVIRAAAPGVTETIAYGIPAFTLDGRVLLYCAAWKAHTSVYPLTATMRRKYATAIAKYETSKGTIRFPLDAPLPVALLKRLVKTRAAEARSRAKDLARRS